MRGQHRVFAHDLGDLVGCYLGILRQSYDFDSQRGKHRPCAVHGGFPLARREPRDPRFPVLEPLRRSRRHH